MTEAGSPIGVVLLVATLATPLALLAACLSGRLRPLMLSIQGLAALPGLAAAIFVLTSGPAELDVPALRLALRLDAPGALMLAASALLWTLVGTTRFTDRSVARDDRFAVSWLLTMIGSLGVFVAGDLISFYLFYALVSIPAYGMIVTNGDLATKRVGAIYMAFAILGEALLLLAFAMLSAGAPGQETHIVDVMAALPTSPWRDAAVWLVIAGFGMKMGLVPFNGWMPLSYATGPLASAAVLSGAAVKAGVIGLIRFLPLGAAWPDLGLAMMTIGFVSSFYGVAIGLTQSNPRAALGYSSVSQMGVVAVLIGAALVSGDAGAPTKVAFYAANHVLVKGALFVTIAAFAARTGRSPGRAILAVALALSLAGLPLTGGALAKMGAKDLLGYGLAGMLANLSSAASALLMLHFVARVSAEPPDPSASFGIERLARGWPAVALGALFLPFALYLAVGGVSEALSLAKIWDGLWPILLGGAVGAALVRLPGRRPSLPTGDTIVVAETLFARGLALGRPFDRIESVLRQWPAASLSLVAIVLLLVTMAAYSG